jgi:hypothetical protein
VNISDDDEDNGSDVDRDLEDKEAEKRNQEWALTREENRARAQQLHDDLVAEFREEFRVLPSKQPQSAAAESEDISSDLNRRDDV